MRLPFQTLAMAALGLLSSAVHAAWPERPIRLVVPYPAGGAADSIARVVATQLSERLKQQVLVENRAGAGGTVGAQAVAQAPADGYTFLYDATSFAVNPNLPGFQAFEWNAVFAPAATPADIVARMEGELQQVLAQPAVRQRLDELGAWPAAAGARELDRFVKAETAQWARVIKTAGITLD